MQFSSAGGNMASPGSTHTKQLHDPKEQKRVTNQSERVRYLFKTLRWRGGRRSFEVWESDGGNVPAEEEVYLINGELRRGKLAAFEWHLGVWWKKVKLFFRRLFHREEPQT
jgi:hypothetical protein